MMATKKVDLKPIGRAMKRAKHDLQELAERASPDGRKEIRGRIKQLDILIRQLPKVCMAPVFKKPFSLQRFVRSSKRSQLLCSPQGVRLFRLQVARKDNNSD